MDPGKLPNFFSADAKITSINVHVDLVNDMSSLQDIEMVFVNYILALLTYSLFLSGTFICS